MSDDTGSGREKLSVQVQDNSLESQSALPPAKTNSA
jgi:hypothetical protein